MTNVMTGRGMRSREDLEEAVEHREGWVARQIEKRTAQLPSDVFLWAAMGSITGSLGLRVAGYREDSIFVGMWAPTFLLFGLYNKVVKVAGSDRSRSSEGRF